jgi:hypothetical protein
VGWIWIAFGRVAVSMVVLIADFIRDGSRWSASDLDRSGRPSSASPTSVRSRARRSIASSVRRLPGPV